MQLRCRNRVSGLRTNVRSRPGRWDNFSRWLDAVLSLKPTTRRRSQSETVSGRSRWHQTGSRRWRQHRERVASERRQWTERLAASVDNRRYTSRMTGRQRQRRGETVDRAGILRRQLIVGRAEGFVGRHVRFDIGRDVRHLCRAGQVVELGRCSDVETRTTNEPLTGGLRTGVQQRPIESGQSRLVSGGHSTVRRVGVVVDWPVRVVRRATDVSGVHIYEYIHQPNKTVHKRSPSSWPKNNWKNTAITVMNRKKSNKYK